MSHYARLVASLPVYTVATRERVELPIDTEIKRVRIEEDAASGVSIGSHFVFEARIIFQSPALRESGHKAVAGWLVVQTDEDLPAFTDKGRAHRARQVHATLQPGRPLTGEEHVLRPVALRVSEVQREWVQKRAKRRGLTVSEYLRSLLEAAGMPG